MLSLSEGLLFWFAPAGDGMEPAWSLSIPAPVDPSEPCSSPEMRRHGADLLFRGYSSPVDRKTIELCRWSSQAWARAVQDGWSAWTETEWQERNTDRKKCLIFLIAPGSFLLLWSVRCGDEKQREECCQGHWYSSEPQVKGWDLSFENIIVLRWTFWEGHHFKKCNCW